MQCADLTVPLDWTKPGGRKVTLKLGRLAADGPEPAEGTVLVNYGGPGAPGIQIMRDRAFTPDLQPFGELRHRMDVVTWDPRGYGGFGTPNLDFSCLADLPEQRTLQPPRTSAEFAKLAATNRANAHACRPQDPELFDHMDSATNARDMDAIRRALGEAQLNLYMGSYGGVYGQTYARSFPGRIRTMAIDGSGDHSGDFDRAQDAIARDNVTRMNRFVGWCARERSCALHGRDVRRVWQRLVAKANREPIPASVADVEFDGWTLQLVATGRLIRGDEQDWPKLAEAIVMARNGDASGFVDSKDHPFPRSSYPISECKEWPRIAGFWELRATVARLDRIDRTMGAAGTQLPFQLTCIGWPANVDNPPRPLPTGTPPLLGVGTWTDFPATNRVVERVPGSMSIYHDGNGHELYATGNTCVIEHVDRYFTDRVLPRPGTRC